MKKYLLSILSVFLFLLCSGCGKAEFQLAEDKYYLCSTNGIYDAGTVLLDRYGEIIKSFPNMYVHTLVDTSGHVLDQYAGEISKDMILIMSKKNEINEYDFPSIGVYRVGEPDWILEPRKTNLTYSFAWKDSRFSGLQIDGILFNSKFEITDEYIENDTIYYGKNGYHTQVSETCDNKIVDQNEHLILDANTFYNKNKSIVPYFPENTELSMYDLINEDCMIVEYSHYIIGETLTGTFKQLDYTYLYFCTPDGTLLGTDLDYSENYSIRRESHNSYNLDSCASKKYLCRENDNGDKEYLKVDGKTITKLHLPDTGEISFFENGFYLIKNGNNYTIYDGEEDKETLSFTSDLSMGAINILGQNSCMIIGFPEAKKGFESQLILSGKEIPTFEQKYTDIESVQTAGQYSIFHPLNGDRKSHSSYITERTGKCIYKTDKNVIWIDEHYMLVLEDNIYFIYDKNNILIKKITTIT